MNHPNKNKMHFYLIFQQTSIEHTPGSRCCTGLTAGQEMCLGEGLQWGGGGRVKLINPGEMATVFIIARVSDAAL